MQNVKLTRDREPKILISTLTRNPFLRKKVVFKGRKWEASAFEHTDTDFSTLSFYA